MSSRLAAAPLSKKEAAWGRYDTCLKNRFNRMFSTPAASDSSRRGGARRVLQTTAGRLLNSGKTRDTDETEHPLPSEGEGNSEVLAILRSLQQQVSALQTQQQQQNSQAKTGSSPRSTSTASTPNSAKKKLPKDLVSTVHQAVKNFRDRDEDPLEWNTSICFSSQHNSEVTAEIVRTVTNEEFSASMVRRATRTYFLTLQRRSKRLSGGNLVESQKKQRKLQRKHNKLRYRRSACLASTSLSQEEREKYLKILLLDFMSSEETGSESGSGAEMDKRRSVFLTRPLPWRSSAANDVMQCLDRKIVRRRSERAKEMCRARKTGLPSPRSMPSGQVEAWAVNDKDNCL